jgi:hypothetical protein
MRYARSGDIGFMNRVTDLKVRGIVHSTFKRIINIHCLENDELFTIASREIDNAPNTLVIDIDNFNDLELMAGDIVYSANQRLCIGSQLVISLEKAVSWESRVIDFPDNFEVIKKNLFSMKQYIEQLGKGGGIKKSYQSQNLFDTEMSKMLEARITALKAAINENDSSRAVDCALKLIGLGPGLTPSGDDFLVGLFTIMNIRNSPLFQNRTIADEVVKEAKVLTNDISYIALKKAAHGHVRESITQLVEVIFTGSEEELFLSLNKVLTIGSSSGTDIALGLVFGLEANMNAGGQTYDSTSSN